MRTLMLTILAAASLLLAAGMANAGMMSSSDLTAIDSSNYTVVSISSVSSPIVASTSSDVSLDSNGLWLASDYSKVSASHEMASSGTEMNSSSNLYCFDFTNKFCAVAY